MMTFMKKGLLKGAGIAVLSLGLFFTPGPEGAQANPAPVSQEAQWLNQDMGASALNFEGLMYLPLQGAFQALGVHVTFSPEGQEDKILIQDASGAYELYRSDINGVPHIAYDKYGAWYPLVVQGETSYVSLTFLQAISQRALAVTGPTLGIIDFAPVYDDAGNNTNPIWQPFLQAYKAPGQDLVATAQSYLGVPYVYGGMSPAGFDCSGFTSYVYAQAGIGLPRTAAGQRAAAQWISEDQAQPGDLVFWGSPSYHVGIYLGDGNYIHAPAPGQTVRIQHKSQFAYSSLGRVA